MSVRRARRSSMSSRSKRKKPTQRKPGSTSKPGSTGSTDIGQILFRQDASAGNAPATKAAPKPASRPATDDSAEDVPAWAAKVLEEVLTCTYWLDPGEQGEPFSATIKFSGQRTAANGKGTETFWQEQTVHQIVPGTGPVA